MLGARWRRHRLATSQARSRSQTWGVLLLLGAGFLGGVITELSPCVLSVPPVLPVPPIIVAGGSGEKPERWGP